MKTQKKTKIRILLVDDHIVLRMGLVTATNGEPDMEIVGEAENGAEALEAFRETNPDVVVLDLRMPEMNGFETIRLIKKESPSARILVFSNYADGDEVLQAFREGALGFVVKEMPLEQLLDGIRKVNKGEQFMPPEISARLSSRVVSQLSPRELEVLSLVARGLSNKEIANELHLVEGTVKVHLTNILSKLGVSDRTQAILAAVKRGIISID
ncbi:response regulator transcription factor [Pelagicoccus sp. SDUM812005]|uniref:response regulator transcription factor n=1 Tax=Pelagicoccus sp. SDUM812005 TaxID=3041257 RepID=UPI00280D5E81|nr:response regulator transcription factor [Pelagicoccus sp. SDUM812005]MDQ8183765.1 response regulator transcription factor [Pelagicoccus sp. SDUM812005]